MKTIEEVSTLVCEAFDHKHPLKSCEVCNAPEDAGLKQSQPYGVITL